MTRSRLRPGLFVSVTILLLLVAGTSATLIFSNRTPVIEALEPAVASDGDTVTIRGRHFGEHRGSSYIQIAGRRITTSNYQSWSDEEIALRVPQFTESGLVEVHTGHGASSGALLRHAGEVPLSAGSTRNRPVVEDFSPSDPAVGDLVTISGRHFGERRGASEVIFPALDGGTVQPDPEVGDYRRWSPNEIVVRVPSGAISGNVHMASDGESISIGSIAVRRVGGTKTLGSGRLAILERNIRVHRLFAASSEGSATLWLPGDVDRPVQRPPARLSSSGPAPLQVTDGMHLYEWPIREGDERTVGIRWNDLYERRSVVADLSAGAIRSGYDAEDPFVRRYTRELEGLPISHEEIVPIVNAAASSNPLTVARNSWSWMQSNLTFSADGSDDVVELITGGEGSAAAISDLFVTILRGNGIPARPVRGVILAGHDKLPFYSWAEFYLDGFGWIPVDAARSMGAGAQYFDDEEGLPFGELDTNVLELRAGVPLTPVLHPDSHRHRDSGRYAPWSVSLELRNVSVDELEWRNPILLGSRSE